MKVYYHLSEFKAVTRAVVTSGTFDGVHTGHQRVLQQLYQITRQVEGESVVLTYHPHPRHVLFPEQAQSLKLLHTLDEKIEHIAKHQVAHLLILPFTHQLAEMTSKQFIEQILIQTLQTYKLVIGYDHRFGKNREGSFEYLQKNAHLFGFSVEEIARYDIERIAVSSTKIRQAISQGDIALANQLLGYHYCLTGQVVKGDQLGRTIGFPTANLQITDTTKLLPADGIYAVRARVNEQLWQGMCYLGTRTSLSDNQHRIELNIFDFEGDLYDQRITIYFQDYLRGEMTFDNLEAMKAQLHTDKLHAQEILQSYPFSDKV